MDPVSREPIQTDGHRRNVYDGTLAEAGRSRFRSMVEKLQVLVDGGKATPGPPLGPALGPLGVNIVEILKAINEKTKSFEGMKVPVTLLVDPKTKGFSIEVGTPPTSALIVKELKVEKGSGDAGKTRVGNLSLNQAIKVANMKADAMLAKTLKARVLEVVGTCVSMGVTVDGKSAKDASKEIQAGKYDKQLAG
jgi:large subunit ribosomal protein L11